MYRSARTFGFALPVEVVGNGKSVGIQFDDAIDRRPVLVYGGDSLQVLLRNRARGQLARLNGKLQIRDRRFFKFESREFKSRTRRGWAGFSNRSKSRRESTSRSG